MVTKKLMPVKIEEKPRMKAPRRAVVAELPVLME
jgi:hypothetical protein